MLADVRLDTGAVLLFSAVQCSARSMSLRKQVFNVYRQLIRTTRSVFGADGAAAQRAREEIQAEFRKHTALTDESQIHEQLKLALAVDRTLRYGLLQGRLNETGNYQVTFPAGFSGIDDSVKKRPVMRNGKIVFVDHKCSMDGLVESSSQLSIKSLYNLHNPPYLTHVAEEFSGPRRNNYLKGCKWSPDGTCILTNSADSSLRLFNAPDLSTLPSSPMAWKSVLQIREVDLVYDYCWYPQMSSLNPATSCFLTTAKTAPIHLWDAFSGQLRASYIAKDSVDQITAAFSLAMDADGSQIYAGYDNFVRIFDISRPGEDCDLLQMGRKHEKQGGMISCIACDPSGVDLIACGSYNRSVGIYTPDGDMMTLMEGHKGGVTHVKFSKDGLRLYSGARQDNTLVCWDLRTGKILYELRRNIPTNQRIYFDIDPNEEYLCSGQGDGQLCMWSLKELADGPATNLIPRLPDFQFAVHDDMTNGVSWHPSWCILATTSGQRRVAHLPTDIEDDPGGNDTESGASKSGFGKGEDNMKLWYVG